jgi:hypothetical protein
MTYPNRPNAVTKKKYYEFIQNLPLFIPVESMSGEFSKLIDKYPVTPYLDNRESLIRWTHFIHNKINQKLEKPTVSLNDFFITYYDAYKREDEKDILYNKIKEKILFLVLIFGMIGTIYYLYDK